MRYKTIGKNLSMLLNNKLSNDKLSNDKVIK